MDWLVGAGQESGLIGNIHDINARVDYKVDQHSQWNFWVYNGRDKYGLSSEVDEVDSLNRRVVFSFDLLTSWQNTQIGSRYSHEFKSNHFGSFTTGYSRFVYSNLFTGVHGNYLAPSIRAAGLDPANLPESDPSKMNFGGASAKAWKDIWGCGQGIGAVDKIQPAGEFVAQLKREYAAAKAELLARNYA